MSQSLPDCHAISGHLEYVDRLSAADRRSMLRLMMEHYWSVRELDFERDLAGKQWVICLRDHQGALCGFSTQVLWPVPGESNAMVLFSGDTVVAKNYRHSPALAGLWGRLALKLIDQHPGQSLYWYLISKGYKTYRFLPLFFHEFHPRVDVLTPEAVGRLIDALGKGYFGDRYCPARRILWADVDTCRLKPDVAPLDHHRLQDRDVAFFAQANPGHARGDELCCLAPLSRSNLTKAAFRVIGAVEELAFL
jgi:hypothetical protein